MGGSLNPMALLMGGGSFFTLSAMIWGLKIPLWLRWLRYPGIALCVALGLTCFLLALQRGFQKAPERRRYTSKKAPPVDLPPEIKARVSSTAKAPKAAKPRRTPPPGAA